MTTQYAEVRRKLGKLRNHIRWMFVAHGMARVLIALALMLIWHFLTDTFLELPLGLRAGALVLMGLVVLVVFVRSVVYPLTRRLTDYDLALLVEKEYPLLQDRLITALQFHDDPSRYRGFASDDLARQVVDEGFEVAARLKFKEVVQSGRLLMATGVAAACCLGFFALLGVTWDSTSRYWVDRLLLSNVEYPRKTHLVVKFPTDLSEYPTRDVIDLNLTYDPGGIPPLVTVARGTGVRVIATPSGVIPDEARIRIRSDGETRTFPMRAERGTDNRGDITHFSYNITSVLHERQEVWIESGDATEGPFAVRSVTAPALRSGTEVVYEFPQYMRREPWRQMDVRALTAPEGTRATIVFQSDQVLADAKVRFYATGADPQEIIPTAVEGTENAYTFSVDMTEAVAEYEYVLVAKNGLRNTESYRYPVRTEADRAPEVSVEFHGRGLEDEGRVPVTLSGQIPLRFSVKDKYGVRLWRLGYRVPRDSEEWRWHQDFETLFNDRARAAEQLVQASSEFSSWLQTAGATLTGDESAEVIAAAIQASSVHVSSISSALESLSAVRRKGLVALAPGQVSPIERVRTLMQQVSDRQLRSQFAANVSRSARQDALNALVAVAQDLGDSAKLHWETTGRDSVDQYTLSIGSIAKDCGYETDASISERVKTSGAIEIEVRLQALDFNLVSDRADRGTGLSQSMLYSLTTPKELEAQISRYIRSRLKEDFLGIQRAQTGLLDGTQIFIEQRFSLDFRSDGTMSADALAGRQRLTSAQLTQARLPDDTLRLMERFGNVAQAYIFNEIEPPASNRDQENAIHTIRLALGLLTCDTSIGSLVASQVQAARSRELPAADRGDSVQQILETLNLIGGHSGVRESFRRVSFADYLANTNYDQPSTLRMLDQAYRTVLRDESSAEDRRSALVSIANAQIQTLEGLKIAAVALRKWEGFDQIREELQRMIDEQERIRSDASRAVAPGR